LKSAFPCDQVPAEIRERKYLRDLRNASRINWRLRPGESARVNGWEPVIRRTNGPAGIPKDTLYSWRSRARAQGLEAAQASETRSTLSSEEKFAVVVESAALNAVELSEYCRRKGLYPQQIAAWKASCMQANAVVPAKQARAEVRVHKQQLKALERELRRKDKALAEAAALLVLEKKLQTVRSADAGERSTWRNDAP
jgi:transposase